MAFSYDKLWKLSIDKKINKTQLRDIAGECKIFCVNEY